MRTCFGEAGHRLRANVFDLLAVAGCDLCVRACWVKKRKSTPHRVKSAEKDSFGVEDHKGCREVTFRDITAGD